MEHSRNPFEMPPIDPDMPREKFESSMQIADDFVVFLTMSKMIEQMKANRAGIGPAAVRDWVLQNRHDPMLEAALKYQTIVTHDMLINALQKGKESVTMAYDVAQDLKNL